MVEVNIEFSHDELIKTALTELNLESTFNTGKSDSNSDAYRSIWINSLKKLSVSNPDSWLIKQVTLSNSPPELPDGWAYVPSDFIDVPPEFKYVETYKFRFFENNKFAVQRAGQSFIYIPLLTDIRQAPAMFQLAVMKQFLVDVALRYPSATDKYQFLQFNVAEQLAIYRKSRVNKTWHRRRSSCPRGFPSVKCGYNNL